MMPRTRMSIEIAEIPEAIERQIARGLKTYWDMGAALKDDDLAGFVTCARGTSDHAVTFFKYLMEINAGLPVASIGPSVASVYNAKLHLERFACLTFSQSGASPDLAALQSAARRGGAKTLAILNNTDSPVGKGADRILPIHAGPEKAVAATKSFTTMLCAILGILAGYRQDTALKQTLLALPELARQALTADWSPAMEKLAHADSVFCIARGPALAIAGEAALKLKETCRLHAEAYSSAELLHGPVAIADKGLVALLFHGEEKHAASLQAAAEKMGAQGAAILSVTPKHSKAGLWAPRSDNAWVDPILQIIAFYRFIEELARKLGYDPDAPAGLKKVTETV